MRNIHCTMRVFSTFCPRALAQKFYIHLPGVYEFYLLALVQKMFIHLPQVMMMMMMMVTVTVTMTMVVLVVVVLIMLMVLLTGMPITNVEACF